MPIPPRSPAENFAALLAWLGQAVVARAAGGRLSLSLIALIIARVRGIKQRFARLAASIREGRYTRRRVTAPQRRAAKPRRQDPLPQTPGWLLKLVPEAVGSRAQLEALFRDPAMAALMEAAPASFSRPLRSLCRMLGVCPPPILVPPARRPADAAAPQAPPSPPPQRGRQGAPQGTPQGTPRMAPAAVVPARACGPPHPA